MTNHDDQLSIAPDPVQAEELRQRLHARLAAVSRESDLHRSELHLGSDRREPAGHDIAVHDLTLSSSSDPRTVSDRARRRRVLAAAAAIVVVAAVAAIAIRIEDPSRVTTTAPAATTEQYASVVREHAPAIQEWAESCTHMECSFPQYAHESYVTLRTLLADFERALAALPPPPGEISTLVERTKGRVHDAIEGIDQGLPCHAASPQVFLASPRCAKEWSEAEAEAAYRALLPVFGEWSPYT